MLLAHRVICVILLGLAAACASAPPPEPEAPERPFIKLAQRQMALVVRWRAPAPSPAFREQFERALAKRLTTTYRVEAPVFVREGPVAPFDTPLLLALVAEGVDDAVVVDVQPADRGGLSARAWVDVLQTGARAHALTVEQVRGRRLRGPEPGLPEPDRLADLVMVKLTQRWTDPGAAPAMDPLDVADRLARQRRCPAAVQIYGQVMPARRAGTFAGLKRISEAQSRFDRCKEEVAVQRALAEDARATYEVRLDAEAVGEPVKRALQAALSKGDFAKRLSALTYKPVTVTAVPGSLVLRLRFHPERYAKAIEGEPKLVQGYPVVHLEPFLPAFDALVDLKARAVEALPAYDRGALEAFHVMLRLEKLPRDRVEVDFAELDGRVLLPDSVRVKLGRRQETSVTSLLPDVTRSRRIVLGAPQTGSGTLTPHGLLFEFFELER